MSIDIRIYKFEKPSSDELRWVKYFDAYNDEKEFESQYDEGSSPLHIMRFLPDDKSIEKVPQDFFVRQELKQWVTDKEKLYRRLGFSEKSIAGDRVHLVRMVGSRVYYSDGEKEVDIWDDEVQKYDYLVDVSCLLVKTTELFDAGNSDIFCYEREALARLQEAYPDFETYKYEKATNEMLAKAEIPFLIYERNMGMCFLYIDN